ncbi:YraN family protein [Clostridium sp. cel8]|jgi:putative endonuclease|uniref:YraN family protein n=1 Tax=unclassified Clostridium TaxID=2614128 RepID=UPI0015F47BAB|nr:YraN family protein [Clostridium sp. cel8]MBA5850482.1 YraN family protein [Clostridium sp. cel8]
MKNFNKKTGDLGESIAEMYLSSIGYKIMDRNFRCRIGEIDIIGKDADYICFIEVKTRKSIKYGFPYESVNYRKQLKIYKVAKLYILKNKIYNLNYRFDVVEIILNMYSNKHNIKLIKNAFYI